MFVLSSHTHWPFIGFSMKGIKPQCKLCLNQSWIWSLKNIHKRWVIKSLSLITVPKIKLKVYLYYSRVQLGLFQIEEQLEQNNSPPTLGCDQGQGGTGPSVCQRWLIVACGQDVTLTGHIYDWRRVNTSTWSFLSSSLYNSTSSFPSILLSISPLFSFTYTLSFLPPLLLLYQPECQLLLKSHFLLSPTPSFWCISFLSHPPFYIQLLQRNVMQRLTRFSSKVGTAA